MTIEERIDIGLLANGGRDYDIRNCECDPESNQAPCRYCAIYSALQSSLKATKALRGMLENYIELKRIALAVSRHDTPHWVGAKMTPDDDIHVQAARKALGGYLVAPPVDNTHVAEGCEKFTT